MTTTSSTRKVTDAAVADVLLWEKNNASMGAHERRVTARRMLRDSIWGTLGVKISDQQARALLRKGRAPGKAVSRNSKNLPSAAKPSKVRVTVVGPEAAVEAATVGTGGLELTQWTQSYFVKGTNEVKATQQALAQATRDVPEHIATVVRSTTRGTATGYRVLVTRHRLPRTTEEFTAAVQGILGR